MKRNKIILCISICLCGFLFSYAGGSEPQVMTPAKKSFINGFINNPETKRPLKEVNIIAYLDSKKEMVVTSDNKGNYIFDDLKPGIYTLIFQKSGYKKVTREKIIVKVDESFMLDIEMIEDEYGNIPSPFHFSN
ncbi:MAG: carboxypeptidase regulatory-like domain-containing protein [Chitinophagaceae bacterium]|jgi:hypothetical protein|nr:carboxypeptidase regulatory-like domain-containing protein [Chitinophagaceae bacterium]